MNNKKKKNAITNVIVIVVIFSFLQTYLLFLDQFATVVMATTQSSVLDSLYIPENEANNDVVISEENTDENNEEMEEHYIPEVVQETVSAENEETDSDEKVAAEFMDSTLEIMKSYRFSDGIVLQVKINDELANIKSNLDSGNIKISVPNIEGYSLRNTYIDEVNLDSEDFDYDYSVTENNEILINLTNEDKSSVVLDDLIVMSENTEENDITNIEDEVNEEIELVNISGEYIITYIFDGETEVANISLSKNIDLNYPENDIVTLNTEFETGISIEEKEENIYSVSAENASMYKGYMYANAVSSIGYETNYTSINNIEINSIENIDNIVISDLVDNIVTKDGSQISLAGYGLYKETKVNVEEFNTIFGNDGYIEVFSSGRAIGRIDSSTQIVDDNYVFTYKEDLSNVEFSLNNMVGTGNLEILNDKVISQDIPFNRTQIMNFKTIVSNVIIQEYSKVGETEIKLIEENKNLEINLEDTESKMDLELSTDSLSTSLENDVTFTITLKTNEEKYELFQNPIIEIELPSDIESIDINSVNVLYKNGLTLDKYEIVNGEYGIKTLRISLTGTQTEYTPGLPSNGTTINVFTTINLNRLTTNKEANIKFTYKNEVTSQIAYVAEGKDCIEVPLNFVSKYGMLRSLRSENKNTSNSVITYDSNISELELEMNSVDQIINYKGTIVNNFETTLNNVTIIGKIPNIETTDDNGISLGTTINTTLNSEITTLGSVVDIYYSENANSNVESTDWTQDISDISKYKAYKLVFKNNDIQQGEKLEFSFDMKIPDNLSYNQKAYTTYTVYYQIDGQTLSSTCTDKLYSEEKDITIGDIVDKNEQNISDLSIKTNVKQCGNELVESDSILEREIVEYTIYVKNNSNAIVNNVDIKASVVNSNLYYKYIFESDEYDGETMETYFYYMEDTDGSKGYEEFTIDTLAPGEEKTFTYQAIAKDVSDNEDVQMYSKINVSADNIDVTEFETIKNKIENTKLSLKLEWAYRQIVDYHETYGNSGLKYRLYVKNISNEIIENQEVSFIIPNFVEYKDSEISGAEDCVIYTEDSIDSTILTIKIPEIQSGEEKEFFIPLFTNELDVSLESKILNFYAYTNIDNQMVKSNLYEQTIYQNKTIVEYSFTSDKDENTILKDGDEVKYYLTLKNVGLVNSNYLSIYNILPNGLVLKSAKLIQDGQEENIDITNDKKLLISGKKIKKDEEIKVEIVTQLDEDDLNYDQNIIENKVSVGGGVFFDSFDTNIISLKVNNSKVTVNEEIIEDENNDIQAPEIDDTSDLENDNDQVIGSDDNTNSEQINDENTDESINENEESSNNTNSNTQVTNNDSNNSNKTDNSENTNTLNNTNDDNISTSTSNNTSTNTNTSTNVKTKLTYKISGKTWLDKNKNGIYDNSEELLPNINVTLYKVNESGKIDTNTAIDTIETDTKGAYSFDKVEAGKYIVTFNYDTDLYSETIYQVDTAKSTENSDAISKKVDESDTKVAMTDIIEISSGSIINIDLGLVLKNEFDLSLEKYVSSATITNSKGTQRVTFNRDSLVKLEINSKLFEKSSIDITYKIIVKNDGDISGYVNKVSDYLPEGLTFDQSKNKDWYQSEDGNLYYTGLIDKEIQAGNTKEITLILHAESNSIMSQNLINMAEITEASNDKGLNDIDSTLNNKIENEDDYGKVELIITLSTGRIINIVLIVLIIISIISIISIFIIKYKKTEKVYR